MNFFLIWRNKKTQEDVDQKELNVAEYYVRKLFSLGTEKPLRNLKVSKYHLVSLNSICDIKINLPKYDYFVEVR